MSLRSPGAGKGHVPTCGDRGTGHINDTLAKWGSSLSALDLPGTCGSLIPSMSARRWISAEGSEEASGFSWEELACQLLMGEMSGQALTKPLIYKNCRAGVCFSTQGDKKAT